MTHRVRFTLAKNYSSNIINDILEDLKQDNVLVVSFDEKITNEKFNGILNQNTFLVKSLKKLNRTIYFKKFEELTEMFSFCSAMKIKYLFFIDAFLFLSDVLEDEEKNSNKKYFFTEDFLVDKLSEYDKKHNIEIRYYSSV